MTSSARRFAVIDCEDAPKWAGHERLWIERWARPGETWEVFRAHAGELPTDPAAYQAVTITGSHYSVNDALGWVDDLTAFVRRAAADANGPQLFGACFGCQLLARALGGTVAGNPSGRFVFGAEQVRLRRGHALEPPAESGGEPSAFRLLVSHSETVTELPPGAAWLAESDSSAYEMFAIGTRVLAVQAHPEMTPELLRERILPALIENGRLSASEVDHALAALELPHHGGEMMAILRRFLDAR